MKWIKKIWGKRQYTPELPDIRYAHPSHDPKNRKKSESEKDFPTAGRIGDVYTPATYESNPRTISIRAIERNFEHRDVLKSITLSYLEKAGRNGADHNAINTHVALMVLRDRMHVDMALERGRVRALLAEARKDLKSDNLIAYNWDEKTWYIRPPLVRELTEKESGYLAAKGLKPGWKNIESEREAVNWLHKNFSDDEFENFCVSILSNHCQVPVAITEKRRFSGADGGFDATGDYSINGKQERVAVQAKRYAPHRQVGEEHIDRFAGSLIKRSWRHGFMITTGTYSHRAKASVEAFQQQDIWIELIDQERLIAIMLQRADQPHGFGLHRTDIGLLYINETILKKSGAKL